MRNNLVEQPSVLVKFTKEDGHVLEVGVFEHGQPREDVVESK